MSDTNPIQNLSVYEHMRLRPGMYVGVVSKNGDISHWFIKFLQELALHSDEQNLKVKLSVLSNEAIQLSFQHAYLNTVSIEEWHTVLMNGGVYGSFGHCILIALAKECRIQQNNNEYLFRAAKLIRQKEIEFDSTEVVMHIEVDQSIAPHSFIDMETLRQAVQIIAAFHPHHSFELESKVSHNLLKQTIQQTQGLKGYFNRFFHFRNSPYSNPQTIKTSVLDKELGMKLDLLIAPSSSKESLFLSFVNEEINTLEGSHIDVLRKFMKEQTVAYEEEEKLHITPYNVLVAVNTGENAFYVGPTKCRVESEHLDKMMREAISGLKSYLEG